MLLDTLGMIPTEMTLLCQSGITPDQYSLICLAVGMATVLGLIVLLRMNAFLALIIAAMVLSLMAPGDIQGKFSRVAGAFGGTAAGVGIVIAMAAIIGKCMLDSGAADRIVRAFMSIFGERRAPLALMGSGFVLAVPVFFDTVFYLLVPLGRSLYRATQKNYLLYVMAIATGGAITHTLVPPTPGPLVVADQLNVDKGLMILVGAAIAFPAACAGLAFSALMNRIMPLPMRPLGSEPEPPVLSDEELPSLWVSLLPVLLPVLLISTNTVLTTMADAERAAQLQEGDISNWQQFRGKIKEDLNAEQSSTNFGKHLIASIGDPASEQEDRQRLVSLLTQENELTEDEKQEALAGLNRFVLLDKTFPDNRDAFLGAKISGTALSLADKPKSRMAPVTAERMNREILESVYPEEVLQRHVWETDTRKAANVSSMIGDANLALLLSAVIAMITLAMQRHLSLKELTSSVENSLMSGGLIILITSAGGAFGAMLTEANVGEAIKNQFTIGDDASGAKLMVLLLGFGIAAVLKIAQGSSTVSMITSSGMLISLASPEVMGCHPVYLAVSIGAGSLIGSWMNDSGFWIFAKMSGLTEVEALKSWTLLLLVLGTTSFVSALVMAMILPLV